LGPISARFFAGLAECSFEPHKQIELTNTRPA